MWDAYENMWGDFSTMQRRALLEAQRFAYLNQGLLGGVTNRRTFPGSAQWPEYAPETKEELNKKLLLLK